MLPSLGKTSRDPFGGRSDQPEVQSNALTIVRTEDVAAYVAHCLRVIGALWLWCNTFFKIALFPTIHTCLIGKV